MKGFIQFLIPLFLTLLIAGVLAMFAGWIWLIAIKMLLHLVFFGLAIWLIYKFLLGILAKALSGRKKVSYYELMGLTVAVIVLFVLSYPGLVF